MRRIRLQLLAVSSLLSAKSYESVVTFPPGVAEGHTAEGISTVRPETTTGKKKGPC